MAIVFSPKNFSASCDLFMQVPSYSLKDLIFKSPNIFQESEVEYVEFDPETNKPIRLLYKTSSFEGEIVLKDNFEDLDFDNFKKEFRKRSNFEIIKKVIEPLFSRHSPILWGWSLQVVTGFSLIELGRRYHFGFEYFKNSFPGCDQKCVALAHQVVLGTFSVGFINFFPILIALYFYFYQSKKIRKADVWFFVKLTSFLLLLFGVIDSVKFVKTIQNENTKSAFQIVYSPKEIKTLKRSIASEFEANRNYKLVFKKK